MTWEPWDAYLERLNASMERELQPKPKRDEPTREEQLIAAAEAAGIEDR